MDLITKKVYQYIDSNPGVNKDEILEGVKESFEFREIDDLEITGAINDLFFSGYIHGDGKYFTDKFINHNTSKRQRTAK